MLLISISTYYTGSNIAHIFSLIVVAALAMHHQSWKQEHAGILFSKASDLVNGIHLRIRGTPVVDRRYRWSG